MSDRLVELNDVPVDVNGSGLQTPGVMLCRNTHVVFSLRSDGGSNKVRVAFLANVGDGALDQ